MRNWCKKYIVLPVVYMAFSVSAAMSAGTVSLAPQSDTANVNQTIVYNILLSTDQPVSAYELQVQFTSSNGGAVSTPVFAVSTPWTNASTGLAPVVIAPQMESGIVTLQTSLVGEGATFTDVNGTVVGTLTVTAASAGALSAQIVRASFFADGFTQPEGANVGITTAGPVSVTISGAPVTKPGDVNMDGFRDTQDLNQLVNLIFDFLFGNPIDPTLFTIADVAPRDNPDGTLDTQDYNVLVDLIFEDIFGG